MEPELMLRRLRDHDDRWDGVEYAAPEHQRSPWRGLSIAIAAGLLVGVIVVAGVFGLRGDREVPPSVHTSSPMPTPAQAAPTAPPTSGFLNGEEMQNAWDWDAQHFPRPLPDGVVFPQNPPTGFGRSGGQAYEVGLSTISLAMYWVCAWETDYLYALDAGDEAQQEAAMEQIDAYKNLAIVKSNYPDEPIWYKAVIAPAKTGDTQPMRDDVDQNCAEIETEAGQ